MSTCVLRRRGYSLSLVGKSFPARGGVQIRHRARAHLASVGRVSSPLNGWLARSMIDGLFNFYGVHVGGSGHCCQGCIWGHHPCKEAAVVGIDWKAGSCVDFKMRLSARRRA